MADPIQAVEAIVEVLEDIAIAHLDFEPTCDGEGCTKPAAWKFHCRKECGTAGVICDGHHQLFVMLDPPRRCLRCQIVMPITALVVFAPIGAK